MLHFWGDRAPQHVYPSPDGINSDDDQSAGEGDDDLEKEAGRRRPDNQGKKEGGSGVDEGEIRRFHHNICIELRPERTLAVTWVGALWMSYHILFGTQPQLDFYADTGKLFPRASSSIPDSNRRVQR
jgi:hypothetical protein